MAGAAPRRPGRRPYRQALNDSRVTEHPSPGGPLPHEAPPPPTGTLNLPPILVPEPRALAPPTGH